MKHARKRGSMKDYKWNTNSRGTHSGQNWVKTGSLGRLLRPYKIWVILASSFLVGGHWNDGSIDLETERGFNSCLSFILVVAKFVTRWGRTLLAVSSATAADLSRIKWGSSDVSVERQPVASYLHLHQRDYWKKLKQHFWKSLQQQHQ